MSRRLLGGLVTAGILVAAGAALAAAFGYKAGSETWTEASGKTGASHRDVLTTADYYGLESIKAWEYNHRLCVLEIEEEAFATRDLTKLEPLKVCEPTVGQTWKHAALGSGEFLTSIAVCTGNNKDDPSVHGFRIAGAVLESDGTLKPGKAIVKAEFPDCKKWQPERACPKGSVATGVRAHFDDEEHGLVGLGLRCHALEVRGSK
jgi:hypothetical protein